MVVILKNKRREKGQTLSELAEKIGISEGYLSKLERHPIQCNPHIDLILKLSEELDEDPVKVFLYFTKNKNLRQKKDQDN